MHPIALTIAGYPVGSYGLLVVAATLIACGLAPRIGARFATPGQWLDWISGLVVARWLSATGLLLVYRLPSLVDGNLGWGQLVLAGGIWQGGVIGAAAYLLGLKRCEPAETGPL